MQFDWLKQNGEQSASSRQGFGPRKRCEDADAMELVSDEIKEEENDWMSGYNAGRLRYPRLVRPVTVALSQVQRSCSKMRLCWLCAERETDERVHKQESEDLMKNIVSGGQGPANREARSWNVGTAPRRQRRQSQAQADSGWHPRGGDAAAPDECEASPG
mmetsp:Transcript_95179/g.256002  ORF Transcript_95179/g.256002 Transcript_95179/m.256002 type:complete len:160 (+) Transcript_95179:375-854(+)